MALTKEKKKEVLAIYEDWLKDSDAVFLTEYVGLSMPQFDELRAKIREVGGEFHVIKNSLGKLAFKSAGLDAPDEYFLDSTAIGLAYDDAPGVAKAIKDFGKEFEAIKFKGGFMDQEHMTADQINAMAELPPLPVVRSQLLSLFNTPATQIVRVLSEPGRSLAQVIKAHGDAVAA